ncbi:tyrosine-type recombinase/integrase [Amycolatopsis sp. NBC_01286]|uniref:tyrosine-type recombinase/integrase n=1 Tax=Amycolatopsis sp. NBC_01286 TaxID=2903560 RepID=UPI002E12BD7D|nr:tyrosine-type recombinase/integrase [Amycolatopsis sp. NBC_01286]
MTSDISVQADTQGAGTTSDISIPLEGGAVDEARRRPGAAATVVPAAFVERFDGYVAAKARPGEPLDDDTVRAYCSRTRQFLAWLDGADVDGDPLVDGQARDGAVRNYRAYLLTVAKRKLSTVNAHLTAVDDFLRHVGVGPAAAKRQEVPKSAPRALSDRNRTRWLRAAQRADARGKALAYVEYYGGLRGGEVVALDVGDVRISARKGVLIVRFGKGGKYREVPLHSQLRAAIEEWVTERAGWPGAAETPALFLNRRGGRLSTRGAYDQLKAIAADANLAFGRDGDLTPHSLRHTTGTNLVRDGVDVVLVAELLGHSVETARHYSQPTEADKQAAIERLTVDE